MPLVQMLSLSPIGTPASGLSRAPARSRFSVSRASDSAASPSTVIKALFLLCSRRTRSRTACVASTGETSPA